MRARMLAMLSDGDLTFDPSGQTMTLGALCREMGEIEDAYAQSLKTFTTDWSYRNAETGLDASVERLKAWFESLDGDLKATVKAFSDEDLAKTIERGGYAMPVETQLDVYLQASLNFLGKAIIYLKAMDRPLPKDWKLSKSIRQIEPRPWSRIRCKRNDAPSQYRRPYSALLVSSSVTRARKSSRA